MDTSTKIIIISSVIAFITLFFIPAFGIVLTEKQILFIGVAFFVFLTIIIIYKISNDKFKNFSFFTGSISEEKLQDKGKKYAMKWWKDFTGETLSPVLGRGVEGVLGKEVCVGFTFLRSTVGRNAGQPITIVVGSNPLRIIEWDDNPEPRKIENPFFGIARDYPILPTKSASLEFHPSMWARKYKREAPLVEVHTPKPHDDFYGKRKEE